jgi:hypothetical protein
MAPSSFRQVTLQLEEDFHERGIHIGADGSVLRSSSRRVQVREKVFVVHPGDAWGIIETMMGYYCNDNWDLLGVHAIEVLAIGSHCGAVYALSDIISTRHGAAIQAVRRLQRKFRMWRRQWHELHQWPRMLEDHVAIAKCYFHISNQFVRKSKIERTEPVIIVGSGSGCHATVCGVPRAR